MTFLDYDFLLMNDVAKRLFHDYAEKMPIIDFHCHLNPKEIYENKQFTNLTQLWINEGTFGDHYKWRLMRANGVPEELITGNGDDFQKFLAWAKTIEKAMGNPVYEWAHLELKRFFDINDLLNEETAPIIWKKANAMLATDEFSAKSLIKRSNVEALCTTDDPISDLKYHILLKQEEVQDGFKVRPAMRPDKLANIASSDFADYVQTLAEVSRVTIKSFEDLIIAVKQRFSYFTGKNGCLFDFGLNTFTFVKADAKTLDGILAKACQHEELLPVEINQYQTMLIESLMALNQEFNWTMQFHMNCLRNANKPMLDSFGTDGGFDSMGTQADMAQQFMQLLIDVQIQNKLPKMILYSLNPNDWMQLATGMGNFQQDTVQKIQLGAAWWFNDTFSGMNRQLTIMAEQSLLPNFVGMLTDSRSFLSYPRHEYFRRILCNLVGTWVERGQLPDDDQVLGKMIEDVSYNNANRQFVFN